MGRTVPNKLGLGNDSLTLPQLPSRSTAAYRCGFPETPKSRFASKKGKRKRQLCIVPWSLYPYQLVFYFKFLVHFQ